MTTSEILHLDYYENENIFQKALRKIKPLSKYSLEENIPLDILEKLVSTYEYKYAIMINYICPVYIPGERRMYSVTIKNTEKNETYYIHSSSIYEAFCKISILYYSEVKNGLGLKDWKDKNG